VCVGVWVCVCVCICVFVFCVYVFVFVCIVTGPEMSKVESTNILKLHVLQEPVKSSQL